MTSNNASRVYRYLHAVAAMGAPETVADFFARDVILHEFPNRIVTRGRVSSFADLGAAYEQGRKILKSQEYKVQRVVEAGHEVAVELGCGSQKNAFRKTRPSPKPHHEA